MNKYNGGRWTAARFHSFILSALRAASNRWPPKYETKKAARIERGIYWCSGYNRKKHKVNASFIKKGRRRNNICLDHIIPVVDPSLGFQSWDKLIERLFCEENGFQVLCYECHSAKTADERKLRNKFNDQNS